MPIGKNLIKSLIRIIAVLLLCASSMGQVTAKEVRIALRANLGNITSLRQWQPTADYLSQKIPGYTFKMVPFEVNSLLNQAVSREHYDFVFTNSAAYVELNKRYGVAAIATLVNKGEEPGKAYTKMGSVIFTRADRADINKFTDLKGKTFMAVDEMGFGGWRIAWRALLSHGVNPYKDFKRLSFAGGLQQSVVYAVLDGDVDAGCVRTDTLERMANRGKIRLSDFKVLEPRTSGEMDFLYDTRLYPEWPFAKMRGTPEPLARQVAAALINMPANAPAALAGNYVGWDESLDYKPVDELLEELGIGPYEITPTIDWEQLLEDYWEYLVFAAALFVAAVITIIVVLLANQRLKEVRRVLEIENRERQKAQQQLENYKQHLQEIVQERTAALEAHNQELETYSYSIAHDLRTPLRSIVSFSQILAEQSSGKLDKDELDALQRIVAAGKHLAALIDDILELSRITRSDMVRTTVEISRMAHDISTDLQAMDAGRQVQWRIEEGMRANGDEKLIRILLQNLMDNAWKYTGGRDHAVIEVGKMRQNNSEVFYVRDNGVGFDMAYVDKIFKPFQRLYRTEFEGTGVGLATVQRVTQRHGGNVWAKAEPDQGATFYFTLMPASFEHSTDRLAQAS